MANSLSSLSKEELLQELMFTKTKLAQALAQEEIVKNRYGLFFERKEETCEEILKTHLPLLGSAPELDINISPDFTTIAPGQGPHLLIEGENIHVLHALQQTHKESVDLIYIDPPYNTGNKDFTYNDKFVDKEDGYRHSKWLSFMEKRLKLAKELLKDTGVIFISIDDDEQANLKLLCTQIFGEQNFLNNVIWSFGKMSNESKKFANNHEYVLIFGKTLNSFVKPSIKKEDTEYKERWKNFVKNNKIYYDDVKHKKDKMISKRISEYISKHGNIQKDTVLYDFDIEFKVDSDVIYSPIIKGNADEKIAIFGAGQKPLDLLIRLIAAVPNKNATILDFFGGSGTTLHATMALNAEDGGTRQCILVTNNEGSFEDTANPGQKLPGGIFDNVTYPRIKKVACGYTNNKGIDVPALSPTQPVRVFKLNIWNNSHFVPLESSFKELMNSAIATLLIKENMLSAVTKVENHPKNDNLIIYVQTQKLALDTNTTKSIKNTKHLLVALTDIEDAAIEAYIQKVQRHYQEQAKQARNNSETAIPQETFEIVVYRLKQDDDDEYLDCKYATSKEDENTIVFKDIPEILKNAHHQANRLLKPDSL